MTSDWIKITVTLSHLDIDIEEAVSGAMSDQCGGLEEITLSTGSKQFRGYFANTDAGKMQVNLLREELQRIEQRAEMPEGTIANNFETDIIENSNWATNWKQYFKPQRIGRHFVVYPSWNPPEERQPEDHLLLIDPGQAFGTGQHESTRLCIELMETLDLRGIQVADVGCGSGILSIVAAMLGTSSVVGCDIDPVAVETAAANAERNQVTARTSFYRGTVSAVSAEAPLDLVLANLLADILVDLHDDLISLMRPNGKMIWSGIIEERQSEIESLIRSTGLRIVRKMQQGEWVAYLLELSH